MEVRPFRALTEVDRDYRRPFYTQGAVHGEYRQPARECPDRDRYDARVTPPTAAYVMRVSRLPMTFHSPLGRRASWYSKSRAKMSCKYPGGLSHFSSTST
jgi:hypothetical protein